MHTILIHKRHGRRRVCRAIDRAATMPAARSIAADYANACRSNEWISILSASNGGHIREVRAR